MTCSGDGDLLHLGLHLGHLGHRDGQDPILDGGRDLFRLHIVGQVEAAWKSIGIDVESR